MRTNKTVEEWGQISRVTDHIREVLLNYGEGQSILNELIQNADDAGAKLVKFCNDQRKYEVFSADFFAKEMSNLTGPALCAYNDAVFTEQDYTNLQNIACRGKVKDLTKTGKYGVGFNSVYHLTDVPSIASGESLIFSDPHCGYVSPPAPGLRIRLEHLRQHREQFAGYNLFGGFFDNLHPTTKKPFFQGTLFRFPLRTKEMARKSEMKKEATSTSTLNDMFKAFKENAGSVLLFLRSVERIEWYETSSQTVGPNVQLSPPRLLFSLSITPSCLNHVRSVRAELLERLKQLDTKPADRDEQYVVHMEVEAVTFDSGGKQKVDKLQWLVVHQIGGGEASKLSRDDPSTLRPIGGAAFRKDGSVAGRAFCSLQLPITTGFPFHVNGFFDMPSNRRQILYQTHHEGQDSSSRWNRALAADVIAPAVVAAVKLLRPSLGAADSADPNLIRLFYRTWPTLSSAVENSYFRFLGIEFYKRLWSEPVFFSSKGTAENKPGWIAGPNACFRGTKSAVKHPNGEDQQPMMQVVERLVEIWGLHMVDVEASVIEELGKVEEFAQDSRSTLRIADDRNILGPVLVRKALRELWNGGKGGGKGPGSSALKSFFTSTAAEVRSELNTLAMASRVLFYCTSDVPSMSETAVGTAFAGVPLVICADGVLRGFGEQTFMIADDRLHLQLLSNCLQNFISIEQTSDDPSGLLNNIRYHRPLRLAKFSPPLLLDNLNKQLPADLHTKDRWPREALQSSQPGKAPAISNQWLDKFWKYVSAASSGWADVLERFGDWPLVPTKNGLFIRIRNCMCILPADKFVPSLQTILVTSGCLLFDEGVGPSCTAAITPHLAACTPQGLVSALSAPSVNFGAISPENRNDILNFLATTGVLSLAPDALKRLKSFQLWERLDGSFGPLEDRTTFTVDGSFPPQIIAGINIVLLKLPEDGRRVQLLKELEVRRLTLAELILDIVLPFVESVIAQQGPGTPRAARPRLDQIDPIMTCVLDSLSSLSDHQPAPPSSRQSPALRQILERLQRIPFVRSGVGSLRTPPDLLDPQDALLLKLFSHDSALFPSAVYSKYRDQLLQCGLKTTSPTPDQDVVVRCAQRLHELRANVGPSAAPTKVSRLLSLVTSQPTPLEAVPQTVWTTEELRGCARDVVALLVKLQLRPNVRDVVRELCFAPPQEREPSSAYGEWTVGAKEALYRFREVSHPDDAPLVGTQMPVLDAQCSADPLLNRMFADLRLARPPLLSSVLTNLHYVSLNADTMAEKLGVRLVENMRKMLSHIDTRLRQDASVATLVQDKVLRGGPNGGPIRFYPVTTAGAAGAPPTITLIAATQLVLYKGCPPLMYEADAEFSRLTRLHAVLNIKHEPDPQQLIDGLKALRTHFKEVPLPPAHIECVKRVLQRLVEWSKRTGNKLPRYPNDLPVPDFRNTLRPATALLVIDAKWLAERIRLDILPIANVDPESVAIYIGCQRLTQVITEKLPTGFVPADVTGEQEQCRQWMATLQSRHFLDGVRRLLKHRDVHSPPLTDPQTNFLKTLRISVVQRLPTQLFMGEANVTRLDAAQQEVSGSTDFLDMGRGDAPPQLYLCRGSRRARGRFEPMLANRIRTALGRLGSGSPLDVDQAVLAEMISAHPDDIHDLLDFNHVVDIPDREVRVDEAEQLRAAALIQPVVLTEAKQPTRSNSSVSTAAAAADVAPKGALNGSLAVGDKDKDKDRSDDRRDSDRSGSDSEEEDVGSMVSGSAGKPSKVLQRQDSQTSSKQLTPSNATAAHTHPPTKASRTRTKSGLTGMFKNIVASVASGMSGDSAADKDDLGAIHVGFGEDDAPRADASASGSAKDATAQPTRVQQQQSKQLATSGHNAADNFHTQIRKIVNAAVRSGQDGRKTPDTLDEASKVLMSTSCEQSSRITLEKTGSIGEIKIYIHRSEFSPSDVPRDICVAFYRVLAELAAIFGVSLSTVNMFLENQERIAFNTGGSLFFNIRFFDRLGHAKNSLAARQDAMSFWFVSFAHELAHNVTSAHDKQHEFAMEVLLHQFLRPLVARLTSIPEPNASPAPALALNRSDSQASQLSISRSDTLPSQPVSSALSKGASGPTQSEAVVKKGSGESRRYQEQLQLLHEMGFTDDKRLTTLLIKANGDINLALQWL